MRKVFLYLYPIKEFMGYYHILLGKGDKPFEKMAEIIQKRYREKGYEVFFATYPDRKIYGIPKKDQDKIILTDVTFKEADGYDKQGKRKLLSEVKYPNELHLLSQIGPLDEIVVAGHCAHDCVAIVAQTAHKLEIDALIDLELTDLFFSLYGWGYFNEESFIEEYSPNKLYKYLTETGYDPYKATDFWEKNSDIIRKDTLTL